MGASVKPDKVFDGGFSATVTLPRWAEGTAVHLQMPTGHAATLQTVFHASCFSCPNPSSEVFTFRASKSPGTSSEGNVGFQVNMRGTWSPHVRASCNSACIGAKVAAYRAESTKALPHVALTTLTVTPATWRPHAHVTLRFSADAFPVRAAHASVVSHSSTRQAVTLKLDAYASSAGRCGHVRGLPAWLPGCLPACLAA